MGVPYKNGQNKAATGRWKHLVLSVLLISATYCAFRALLHLPYLADDWAILHKMALRTPSQILALTVDPSLLQIRPLQYFYTWGILALFGTYSSAFHVPALIAHMCCSLLVVYLVRLLTKSTAVGWIVGLLYAVAVNVHLAPQIWMVGSSDILGPLFIFASFILLIRGRRGLSAIAFVASLMFKEFAIPLLAAMAFFVAWENWRKVSIGQVLRQVAGRLWIHVLVALPFLIYKVMFLPSPLSFPDDHPYKMSLFGPHLIRNGVHYGIWLLQTATPFLISRPKHLLRSLMSGNLSDVVLVSLFSAFVITAVALAIVRWRSPGGPVRPQERSVYPVLGVWAVMGMAPVYLLPNHVFSYYMAYALPALLAAGILAARDVARRAGLSRREMIGLAAVALALQCLWSSMFLQRSLSEGDYMQQGAMRVAAVHSLLMRKHPAVPRDTTFVIAGNQMLWALRDDKALQLWYRDRSIRVYDRQFIAFEEGKVYALRAPAGTQFAGTPIKGDRVRLDPASVVYLEVRGTTAVEKAVPRGY